MGQKWKGTVEARKLRFLELYEAGASRSTVSYTHLTLPTNSRV